MAKGKKLTERERGMIAALFEEKKTIVEIAEKLGRSRTVVRNFVLDPDGYSKSKSSGRPKWLSARSGPNGVEWIGAISRRVEPRQPCLRLNSAP
jgi:transposase